MPKSTRRSALENFVAAAGLLVLGLPRAARAESKSAGVFHVFAFQWKPGTSEAQKDRAQKEIGAFQGVIPGLLETRVGPNISPRGKGYTFGGIMKFKEHPAHQKLLAWLVPLIDAIELDLRG